jgi:hypothetical protein
MKFSLGPIDIRFYSGQNWSNFELALVTARKGGMAQRETAVRTGFKSEHLIEVFGEDDPTDAFTAADGTTYFGRTVKAVDGDAYCVSAEQVYARQQRAEAIRQGLLHAEAVAVSVGRNGHNGTTLQPVAS